MNSGGNLGKSLGNLLTEKSEIFSQEIRKKKKNEILNQKRILVFNSENNNDLESNSMDISSFADETIVNLIKERHENLKVSLANNKNHEALKEINFLKRLISNTDEQKNPISYFANLGVIETAVKIIKFEISDKRILSSTCWLLSNVFNYSPELYDNLIDENFLKKLYDLSIHEEFEIASCAFWAIANLGAEDIYKSWFIQVKVYDCLFDYFNRFDVKQDNERMKSFSWILYTFVVDHKSLSGLDLSTIQKLLYAVSEMIKCDSEDREIVFYLSSCFHSFAKAVSIQHLFDYKIPQMMAKFLLLEERTSMILIRCYNLISTNEDDFYTKTLISVGILEYLLDLINSPKVYLRKETCFFVSNILCCNDKSLGSEILSHSIFSKLETIFSVEELIVRREIALAYCSLIFSPISVESAKAILKPETCLNILEVFQLSDDKPLIQIQILNGISMWIDKGDVLKTIYHENSFFCLFEKVGLPNVLEKAQEIKNKDVHEAVNKFIDRYYEKSEIILEN